MSKVPYPILDAKMKIKQSCSSYNRALFSFRLGKRIHGVHEVDLDVLSWNLFLHLSLSYKTRKL